MGRSKIEIFVFGRDKVRWSIDRDRKAIIQLLSESGFIITRNIFRASLIFCVWYDLLFNPKYRWIAYFARVCNKKTIAVITNDITYTPEKVNLLKKFVDICVVPSDKICNFLKGQGMKVYKIPFFVDMNIFRPLEISKQEICQKLEIDHKDIENRIVIGSFQRDSLGKNLQKAKWQKNPDLLIRILEKLPKQRYTLLLAGPRRHYIMKKCKEKSIPFLFYGDYSYSEKCKDDILANNLRLEVINLLYNLTDIYIISSESEGGPKQVIESSLTNTLVFSTKVGLAPDILHPYLLFRENEIKSTVGKIQKFFENADEFNEYIEYNFRRAKDEMDLDILRAKYTRVILEN